LEFLKGEMYLCNQVNVRSNILERLIMDRYAQTSESRTAFRAKSCTLTWLAGVVLVVVFICLLQAGVGAGATLDVDNDNGKVGSDEVGVKVSVGSIPEEVWDKIFGGTDDDRAYSVQQTSDGGYVLAGPTKSYGAGSSDFWLVKTDSNGNKEWDKTFGGIGQDSAESVQQTTDGGYILVGWTYSYGAGSYDFWLVKADSNGNKEWDKTFGGTRCDMAYSVQQTTDGGYILAGWTESYGTGDRDFWLVKTDSNGNKEWDKTFGGTDEDLAYSVQQTTDGGYILAGYTRSYGAGGYDFYLVKTDPNGNEKWNKTFGGTCTDYAYSVQQTTDGGYILAGWTESYGTGDRDFWLVKTDSNGNKEWDKTFGGTDEDLAYSVQQTTDGGYILAGYTRSYGAGHSASAHSTFVHSTSDFWLVKTDPNGNKEWDKTFGGTFGDFAHSVQQTTDGGYIIAGSTVPYGASSIDAWLIKLIAAQIPGDLNSDGTLTPADAAIALQIATGSRPCDPATLTAADVSGDNRVTSLDALMILQAAADNIDL